MTRRTRCLCGILLRYHRDQHNGSLTCAEARQQHPRARARSRSLKALLVKARQVSA